MDADASGRGSGHGFTPSEKAKKQKAAAPMTFFVSCRIMPSMLNPERIPIGKLKQAYGLNEQDIQSLLSAIPSDGIFPDTLWRRVYKSFWFGPMESYLSGYGIGTLFKSSPLDFLLFPEVTIPHDDYFYIRKWKEQILVLLSNLSGVLDSSTLKDGINHIFEEIYDDNSDIFRKEREILFNKIAEEDKNYALQFRTCENINRLLEIMDWKRHAISHECLTFLSIVFMDSIIVNKSAAVRHLFECGYPLRREVKGISHAVVQRITAATATHAPDESPASPPCSAILVPRALWEGKPPQAVRDGMKEKEFDDFVIAYTLSKWCKLTNITQIGRLLGPEELNDSSYLRRGKRLLREAAAVTITTA